MIDLFEVQPKTGEVWYRAEGSSYSNGTSQVYFCDFEVVRKTPKGAWIDVWGEQKFVLTSARKRYAYPTKEEALASLVARKTRRVAILWSQIGETEEILQAAKRMIESGEKL